MKHQKAFALLTAVVIVAFLAAAGLTVYYYKDTVSDKISELRQNDSNDQVLTVTPLPSDTPTPSPSTTPAPTATPKSTPKPTTTPVVRSTPDTSIAEISPTHSPAASGSLPRSGPEEIPLILGGVGSLTGFSLYRYSVKRKYQKALRNITRL